MSQESDDEKTRVLVPAEAAGGIGNPHYALRPGTRLSEFEIVSTIGEGGFGIVYLAWDGSLQRHIALKEYMPSSLAGRVGIHVSVLSERHRDTFDLGLNSFVKEAQTLARFDHPSLVKVHRFWTANGTAYMAMPFYKGTTLKAHLKQSAVPPTQQWLLALLDPLTSALAVVHRDQVYHRDVAPDNILLLENTESAATPLPLLLDFGAARRVIAEATHAPTVILKSGYAPLEQYGDGTDATPQGPWTDIYALGATIHHAIRGVTPQASVHRVISDRYKPLVEVAPAGFDRQFLSAIDQALRIRAAERPQSMAEFRLLLGLGDRQRAGVSGGQAPAPVPPPAPAMPATPAPERDTPLDVRRVGKWVGAGFAVILAGVAAWLATVTFYRPTVVAPTVASSAPQEVLSRPAPVAPASEPSSSVGSLNSVPEPASAVPAPAPAASMAPSQDPRRTEPRPAKSPASGSTAPVVKPPVRERLSPEVKAECDQLVIRMSTGVGSMQDLLERSKALGCR